MTVFDIQNCSVKEGQWVVDVVGYYSPISSVIWQFIGDGIYWPDGTTNIPSDSRTIDHDCPFPDDDIESSSNGTTVAYIVNFVVIGITAIMTFFIGKKYWSTSIEELQTKRPIGINDYVVLFIVLVDFFQYCVMTPDLESLNEIIYKTSQIFSIDFPGLVELKEGVFWMLLISIFAVVFLWLILGAIIIFRLDLRFQNSDMCVSFGLIAESILPIMNNVFFLPIVAILLDVFLCTKEVGSDYTDTFLDVDCHEYCWKDDHIIYVVFTCLCMLAYLPVAIYCRPYW
jgi:hypothetical protein